MEEGLKEAARERQEKGGEHEGGERGLGVCCGPRSRDCPPPYGPGAALQVYGPQDGSWLRATLCPRGLMKTLPPRQSVGPTTSF